MHTMSKRKYQVTEFVFISNRHEDSCCSLVAISVALFCDLAV